MTFSRKNKNLLRGFLLYTLVLGIIITILNLITAEKWVTIISIVVSIGSFLGMVVIFVIQMNESEEQSEVLGRATDLLQEVDRQQKVNTTQVLNDFPENIEAITKKIKEFSNNQDTKSRKIIICTDVVGYGVLSNNTDFYKYFDTLRDIANNRNQYKVDIEWYFYDRDRQQEQSIKQFAAYTPYPTDTENIKSKKLKSYKEYINSKKDIENIKHFCQNCSFNPSTCKCEDDNFEEMACYIIKSIKDNDPMSLPYSLNKLESIMKTNLFTITPIKKHELTAFLPYFAWFFIEIDKEKKETAKEAIIAYPAYKEGSVERCLYTCYDKLVNMFYDLIKDFTEVYGRTIKAN